MEANIAFSLSDCSIAVSTFFIKDLTNKDPKEVVIDEFIGQSIPICLYEIAHSEPVNPTRVLFFYFM